MDNNLMSASEARAFVANGRAQKDVDNLKSVTATINTAIQNGAFSCTLTEVTPNTKRVLESKGYKVVNDPDPRDHTEWWTVAWS